MTIRLNKTNMTASLLAGSGISRLGDRQSDLQERGLSTKVTEKDDSPDASLYAGVDCWLTNVCTLGTFAVFRLGSRESAALS
jgi:hypothetical protein